MAAAEQTWAQRIINLNWKECWTFVFCSSISTFCFIEVWLIYNFCCRVRWFSYTYIYIYIHFKKFFFSIMVYHRILNIVFCAVQVGMLNFCNWQMGVRVLSWGTFWHFQNYLTLIICSFSSMWQEKGLRFSHWKHHRSNPGFVLSELIFSKPQKHSMFQISYL